MIGLGLKIAMLQSVTYAFMLLQWSPSPQDKDWTIENVSVQMQEQNVSRKQKQLPQLATFVYPADTTTIAMLVNHPITIYTVTNHYIHNPDGKRLDLTSEPLTFILNEYAKPNITPAPPIPDKLHKQPSPTATPKRSIPRKRK